MNARASVPGERAAARATSPRSLAVRMQRTFAAAIVLALGLALLTWYYLRLGDDARSRASGGAAYFSSPTAFKPSA